MNCEMPDCTPPLKEIVRCLLASQRIAVVGISPKKERDSHRVAQYLLDHGYKIVPINPGQEEILGQKCYKSLLDIPFRVDMANLFVNSERVPGFVDQAIERDIPAVWMQLGIVNNHAAQKARNAGIQVFMNMCIRTQHQMNLQELDRLKGVEGSNSPSYRG
jgi:predicted CoA-binding protein